MKRKSIELESNSKFYINNFLFFDEINRRIESIDEVKFFNKIEEFISLYKILNKCSRCVSIISDQLLFFKQLDEKINHISRSNYKKKLLKKYKNYLNSYENVVHKPIYSIYKLFEYISFKIKDYSNLDKKINDYILLEKNILNQLDIISDKNTRLDDIVKNNYNILLKDLYKSLSIDNNKDIKIKFNRLKNEIIIAIKSELTKIKLVIADVDKNISKLDKILSSTHYPLDDDFRIEVSDLQLNLLQIKTDVADSKNVLGRNYILKNQIYLILKKHDHLVFRLKLLNKTKEDTVLILNNYKINNINSEYLGSSINKIKSIKNILSKDKINKSYELCEKSKVSTFNQ